MKIRDIDLGDKPIMLAPMEDVTDLSFRLMCREFGADMVYSEFLSADALIRYVPGTLKKMGIKQTERPVALQIYGRDKDAMVEAAKICMEANPDILDINFGCPVKKIAGKGAGSGMMKTPQLMLEITKAVVDAVNIPVTVKTRLGWDENSKIIYELSEQLQDCGIEALTIHGRTRAQMYTGKSDWTLIGEIKNNQRIKIPIIGNGDITTPDEAKNAFDKYGVDGIMIGRASIGRPWIFEEIKHYIKTNSYLEPKHISFYIKTLKKLVINNVEKLDEYRGILHSRRHIAASPIFKGIENFKQIKIDMLRAITKQELFELLDMSERIIIDYQNIV